MSRTTWPVFRTAFVVLARLGDFRRQLEQVTWNLVADHDTRRCFETSRLDCGTGQNHHLPFLICCVERDFLLSCVVDQPVKCLLSYVSLLPVPRHQLEPVCNSLELRVAGRIDFAGLINAGELSGAIKEKKQANLIVRGQALDLVQAAFRRSGQPSNGGMRRQKPRASRRMDASILADLFDNQAYIVNDLINRCAEPLVQISMQQRVAKQRHEHCGNHGKPGECKYQLRSKLGTQLVAAPFEIELEQVAEQDESADDQQDDIERSQCP